MNEPSREWIDSMIERWHGEIFEFELRPGALAKGECIGISYAGMLRINERESFTHIPDFRLTLRGRSRKIIDVSMVESWASLVDGWN